MGAGRETVAVLAAMMVVVMMMLLIVSILLCLLLLLLLLLLRRALLEPRLLWKGAGREELWISETQTSLRRVVWIIGTGFR